jgi:hypothetical protein
MNSFILLLSGMLISNAPPSLSNVPNQVTCAEGLTLRASVSNPSYMLYLKDTNSGDWNLAQTDLICSFQREQYSTLTDFKCKNLNITLSLNQYKRVCFPANNPHHESCDFHPVIKLTDSSGNSKSIEFSKCDFSLESVNL